MTFAILLLLLVLLLLGAAIPIALGGAALAVILAIFGGDPGPAASFLAVRINGVLESYALPAIAFFVLFGRIAEEMDARAGVAVAVMLGTLLAPAGTAFVTLSAGSRQSPVSVAGSFLLAFLACLALVVAMLAILA